MNASIKFCTLAIAGIAIGASVSGAQTLDRSKPPVLGSPPSVSLPPIITRELPNGLKLMIVQHREIPIADFVLVVESGGTIDSAPKSGLANLTAAMLTEGTTTRSSLEISDQAAFLGVNLSASSDWDASTIRLHTPTAQLDSALGLFADVALNPSFPQNEFERVKRDRLTNLLQVKDRPTAIANQAYAAILYGGNHPYGRQLIGTEASVQALATSDLQSFYRSNYVANNATLIVVGDVDVADIEAKVLSYFGGWKQGTVVPVSFTEPPRAATTTVYLVDKPGATQSSFRIGAVGVPRSTRDFFALSVLNTVLGGSFTSRLNQNLRETRGYTYGANSNFSMRRSAGPFTASAEVVGEKTDSALVEFMKELNSIRQSVPAAELQKAKRYMQLGLPGDFETTQQIAAALIPIALYDLPLDYYNNFVQNVEAITQAELQRVANQYINPSSLAIVIVGDRKSIEAGLKSVNAGPIVLRDFFGQPVTP